MPEYHHHEMLLVIPIFLALGFAAGWLARSIVHVGEQFRLPTLDDSQNVVLRGFMLACALVVVVAIFYSAAGLSPTRSPLDSFGIGAAAFVVGFVAGWWFTRDARGLDKAIFVASVAIFIFLVALEYDTKLFGRLNKLTAGGVDVEFEQPKRDQTISNPHYDSFASGPSAAFPKTDATDNALGALYRMGQSVLRDERYAIVLAGDSGVIDQAFVQNMDGPKQAFAAFACRAIEPFAADLGRLQDIHRSETSALAVDPKLVAYLRRANYQFDPRIIGLSKSVCASKSCVAYGACPPPGGSPRSFGEAYCAAVQWTKDETDAVDKIPNKPPDRFPGTSECEQLKNLIGAIGQQNGSGGDDERTAFASYFAMATALAEASIGNGESAIHLLDRQGVDQRDSVRRVKGTFENAGGGAGPCQGDRDETATIPKTRACSGAERPALRAYLRALLTMIRLEVTEMTLMLSEPSNPVGPSALKRLRIVADDIEAALTAFRNDGDAWNMFARYDSSGNYVKDSKIKCAVDSGKGPIAESVKVLSTLAYVGLVQRNNALNILGNVREEYGWEYKADPKLVGWLNDGANLITKFDFGCAKRSGAPVEPKAPAYMYQSVGAYWEAKARRFGEQPSEGSESPFSDEPDRTAIDLYCKAKIAYEKSLEASGTNTLPKALFDESLAAKTLDLDVEIGDAQDIQLRTSLIEAINRTKDALASFPAGELEKVVVSNDPDCTHPPAEKSADAAGQ